MAFIHGKDAFVSVGGTDLSDYTNSVEFNSEADSHDVTTFGQSAHIFQSGLTNGSASLAGVYDSTSSGTPATVLTSLVGSAASSMTYRPEGTGSGKPEKTVSVVVTAYNESVPVADMITWSAELQFSGAVSTTSQ